MKLVIRFLVIFCLLLVGVDGYSLFANPVELNYPPADSFNVSVNSGARLSTGSSSTTIWAVSYDAAKQDETAVSSDEDEEEDDAFSFKKQICAAPGIAVASSPISRPVAPPSVGGYAPFYRHFAYLSSTRYILYRVIRI